MIIDNENWTNNWSTPQHKFNEIMDILSEDLDIDRDKMIDVCCNEQNKKCNTYFTKEQNSLLIDWHNHGEWGWMAAPYSGTVTNPFVTGIKKNHIQPLFVKKALYETEYGFKTIALLQYKKCEQWWYHLIDSHPERVDYEPIIGRFKFEEATKNPAFYIAIVIFGIKYGTLSQNTKEKIRLLNKDNHPRFDMWKTEF